MTGPITICPKCGNSVEMPDYSELVPGNRMEDDIKCPWDDCGHRWHVHTSAIMLKAKRVGEDKRKATS